MFASPKSNRTSWTLVEFLVVTVCLLAVGHALTNAQAYKIFFPKLWDGVACGMLFSATRYLRRIAKAADRGGAATAAIAWKGVRTDFQLALASMLLLASTLTVFHLVFGLNLTATLHETVHKLTDGLCCGILIGTLRVVRWIPVAGLVPTIAAGRTWQRFAVDTKLALVTAALLGLIELLASLLT